MNKWNLQLKTQFHLAPPKMKYLDIYLTEYIQDLYEENYKTLVNEIKKLLKNWSNSDVQE